MLYTCKDRMEKHSHQKMILPNRNTNFTLIYPLLHPAAEPDISLFALSDVQDDKTVDFLLTLNTLNGQVDNNYFL